MPILRAASQPLFAKLTVAVKVPGEPGAADVVELCTTVPFSTSSMVPLKFSAAVHWTCYRYTARTCQLDLISWSSGNAVAVYRQTQKLVVAIARHNRASARNTFDPVPVRELPACDLNVSEQATQSSAVVGAIAGIIGSGSETRTETAVKQLVIRLDGAFGIH